MHAARLREGTPPTAAPRPTAAATANHRPIQGEPVSASPNPHPSPTEDGTPASAGLRRLSKVPEITLSFWIIKILTTGTGESASDWLINRGEGLPWLPISWALVIVFGLFLVAFVLQFAVRRYIPAVYWFAVLAVGIV